jgi:DNA ligase-1
MKTTLYKVDTKGKVREWTIHINNDHYWTVTGIHGGKLITNKPVYAFPKNEGRSNETTAKEQAMLEVSSIILKQREKGYYDTVEDSDRGKDFFSVMLAHPYEKHQKKVVFGRGMRYFVQPKLDGIRSTMQYEGETNKATSRGGKDQPVVAHILEEWGEHLENLNSVSDGELYNHNLKHDFNKITSLVKKLRSSQQTIKKQQEWEDALCEAKDMVQYHIYDMFFKDEPNLTFSERYNRIVDIFNSADYAHNNYIHLVPTYEVQSLEDIQDYYEQFLEQGYEGAIIRFDTPYVGKKTSNMLKYKPMYDSEYELLELIEGTGNRAGMAGAAYIRVPGVDGQKKTNIKGSRDWLTQIWNDRANLNFKGKMITIQYPNLTPDGVPRFPYMLAIRDYE